MGRGCLGTAVEDIVIGFMLAFMRISRATFDVDVGCGRMGTADSDDDYDNNPDDDDDDGKARTLGYRC